MEVSTFPRQLYGYTVVLVAVLGAAIGFLALRDGAPDLPALAVFGGLMVFSAHRDVRLPNGVHVSPLFMVSMASIVAFTDDGSLLGPLVVGAAGALVVGAGSAWRWIPFNAAGHGLPALAAAAVAYAFPRSVALELPTALGVLCLAASAYVVVAWSILVGSYVLEDGRAVRDVLVELLPSVVQVFPFAVLGFFLGRMYLELGAAVMLLIVVPILIAREVFASYLKVKEAHDETVQMLIRALETKDPYTAGHAGRVATYARYIGEELGFGPRRMERLRFAALMHDIGKLVVPNHLLNKPGKLTEEEFRRIRIHEKVSVQMLSHIDFLRPIAAASHSDHTRFDPDDPDHPIEPYIVMIADAYDAMTSTRSYRKALPQDVAFAELRDKAGTQFHPSCVEALVRAIERRGERHGAGHEERPAFVDAPERGVGSAGLGDLLRSEA
jgi:HD superfamily phosphodiesterase